jgi:hypothetical protein
MNSAAAHVSDLPEIARDFGAGTLIPYLGPGMLELCPDCAVPATPLALAASLSAKASLPHKIRNRVTQAAQFIENFKHRKTLVKLMDEAFAATPTPSPLHLALARSGAPLLVSCWYDGTLAAALRQARPLGDWGRLQGLSQSEHFGTWSAAYAAGGERCDAVAPDWGSVVYEPWGARAPASNYLVSDTDFVEVLTEIDIQTPIPREVQAMRSGRGFLFLGCRFDDQLTRSFARQIMKRSAGPHWAVLPGPLTRMEQRFVAEQNIRCIDLPLADFAPQLVAALDASAALAA